MEYLKSLTWSDAKYYFEVGKGLFELTVYALLAIAVISAVWRISKIIEALRAFHENSGPIWDMRQTVTELKALVPTITERLKALQSQVVAIQRNSADEALPASTSEASADIESDDDWEAIKTQWGQARDQLDEIIEEGDGRTTRKYEKFPRYNYSTIIDNLLADELIDSAIAKNARSMNTEFLSLRNRKRPIDDKVKGDFEKLKRAFDRAVREFKVTSAAQHVASPPPGSNGHRQPETIP